MSEPVLKKGALVGCSVVKKAPTLGFLSKAPLPSKYLKTWWLYHGHVYRLASGPGPTHGMGGL